MQANVCFNIFSDNHDIIGLKFYELEVEKDEQTVRSAEHTDDIIPFASKAEAHRGWCIFSMYCHMCTVLRYFMCQVKFTWHNYAQSLHSYVCFGTRKV